MQDVGLGDPVGRGGRAGAGCRPRSARRRRRRRPGPGACRAAPGARPRSSPPAGRRTRACRAIGRSAPSKASRSYADRSSTPQAIVLIVPDVPITVRALPIAMPDGVEVPRDVGDAGGDLLGRRRVGVQVPLVQPHGPHVHRRRLPRSVLAEDQLGGPAADVDDEHRLVGHRVERADRTGVHQGGLLGAGQHVGGHPEPLAHAVDEDGGVAGVAGGRGGAEAGPVGRARRGPAAPPANSSMAAKVRASASSPRSPVVSTPWPRRTTRESRSTTWGGSADEELDRVGAAVDRADRRAVVPLGVVSHPRTPARRRDRGPTTRRAGPAPRRRAG